MEAPKSPDRGPREGLLAVFAELVAWLAFTLFVAWRVRGPLLFAAAAALATWAAGWALPASPEFQARDFELRRDPGDELVVSPTRSLDLPQPQADFDLYCDLQVDAGTTLDVILRYVQPTMRGDRLHPFHGRFVVARLSTRGDGPAVFDREGALFGSDLHSGHGLVPEQLVTLIVRGRGREIDVEIGGKRYPTLHSADAHGGLVLAARGGDVRVRYLNINRVAPPLRPLPVVWALTIAGLVGCWFWRRRAASLGRLARSVLAIPAVAVLGGGVVLAHLEPESTASELGLLVTALAGLPLAWALALLPGRRWLLPRVLFGILGMLLGWEIVARAEQLRLRPLQPPALTAMFGADSGSAPSEALQGVTRSPGRVFSAHADGRPVVLFLGGETLWEDAPMQERWTARLATERAARRLPTTPRPVVVGAPLANVRQQVLLAERHLLDSFDPRLVVLGVGDWEGEPEESSRVVAALARGLRDDPWATRGPAMLEPPGTSRLLDLWAATRAAHELVPAARPPELEVAITRLAGLCEARGAGLLVVAARGVATDHLAAVQRACSATDTAFVTAFDLVGQQDLQPTIARLAELLFEQMRTDPAFAEAPAQQERDR